MTRTTDYLLVTGILLPLFHHSQFSRPVFFIELVLFHGFCYVVFSPASRLFFVTTSVFLELSVYWFLGHLTFHPYPINCFFLISSVTSLLSSMIFHIIISGTLSKLVSLHLQKSISAAASFFLFFSFMFYTFAPRFIIFYIILLFYSLICIFRHSFTTKQNLNFLTIFCL